MAFIAIYDACVLFPNALCDLLMRLGMTGLFRARWTNEILDEVFRSLAEKYPDVPAERWARKRDLMNQAIRDSNVDGYQDLVEALTLPDPNDRHVFAAAIRAGAQVIVTFNLDDFPTSALTKYGIEVQHPDEFVLHVVNLDIARVAQVVREQAKPLKNPPMKPSELLDRLQSLGLPQTVAALRQHVVDE